MAKRTQTPRAGDASPGLIGRDRSGVMLAVRVGECVPVPVEDGAGWRQVSPDPRWLMNARNPDIRLGDR